MPTTSPFYGNPENFRGRKKHHHLDLSLGGRGEWMHYSFAGDQHVHAKVEDSDFWFDSVMLIGERLCNFPNNETLNFKITEMDFEANDVRWRAGVLENNQRVITWARYSEPGFIIKI